MKQAGFACLFQGYPAIFRPFAKFPFFLFSFLKSLSPIPIAKPNSPSRTHKPKMITAIDTSANHPPDPFALYKNGSHYYNTDDWLDILEKSNGKPSKKRLGDFLSTVKSLWENYIPDVSKTFFDNQPKNFEEAQLHAKTLHFQQPTSLKERINHLVENYAKLAQDPGVSWEEKFTRALETLPECHSPRHPVITIGQANYGYLNGIPYLSTLLSSQQRAYALVSTAYHLDKQILIAGHAKDAIPSNTETFLHIKYNDQKPITIKTFIHQTRNTIFLSSHPEGIHKAAGQTRDEFFCAVGQTSILAAASRVVIALTNISNSTLPDTLNACAARLVLNINSFKTWKHPAFTRVPHLHAGFPHQDAIHIDPELATNDAQTILQSLGNSKD